MVDEYVEFCSGLRRLTGVDLTSYKRQQMERRIRTYVDRKAAPTLAAFLRHIQASPPDLDDFLDRITINVSELYRNPEQYELLRTQVLQGGSGVRHARGQVPARNGWQESAGRAR